MPFCELPGLRMFYTEHGSGQPIVLVHGYTCDGNDWAFQIPALAAGYRVITVDLRGHGHSSVPEDDYTPQQFADDVAGLARELELEKVVAIGHSMGGATVTALAARHPQLVRAIVPVDSALGIDRTGPDQFDALLTALDSPAANDTALGFFLSAFYPPASPPYLAAWHGRRVMAMPPHVLRKAFGGMVEGESFVYRHLAPGFTKAITCPALVFRAGRQDPQAVAQWERSLYQHPYSKSVAWEGTGHFLHQERPAEFNAILTAWLEGLPT